MAGLAGTLQVRTSSSFVFEYEKRIAVQACCGINNIHMFIPAYPSPTERRFIARTQTPATHHVPFQPPLPIYTPHLYLPFHLAPYIKKQHGSGKHSSHVPPPATQNLSNVLLATFGPATPRSLPNSSSLSPIHFCTPLPALAASTPATISAHVVLFLTRGTSTAFSSKPNSCLAWRARASPSSADERGRAPDDCSDRMAYSAVVARKMLPSSCHSSSNWSLSAEKAVGEKASMPASRAWAVRVVSGEGRWARRWLMWMMVVKSGTGQLMEG